MAYKVLYRKYRPMTFSDVVGQPQVTVTLKNELMAGRISHAYLFTGSRGTGKTTCAKILAKAVNCLDPQNGDPCGVCEACKGLDNGSILDVVEIDAASNNGIDSIRSLIEESAFTPSGSKYRVYIIDEVHELSAQAFNALLKTLEEPPAHVIFILATTEVHKILPTILSRCQRFDFKRIAAEDIADRLEYVCSEENVTIDREAALLIARIADGGMRDALSILDQCMGRSSEIDLAVVNETAGIAGTDHLFALADDIAGKNSVAALETINELHTNSKDMSKLCEEMISHFRELMLIKTMKDASSMLAVSSEEMAKLTKQALPMSLSAIVHAMDTFSGALDKMRYGNQRVEMEMAMIKLCSPELDSSPEAIIRRIEAIEQGAVRMPARQAQSSAPVREAPALQQEEIPQERPAAPAPSGPVDPDALVKNAKRFNEWPEVLQRMKQYSQSVAAAFGGSSAYISGDFILISGSQLAFDLLKRSSQRDKMKEAIYAVTGRNYRLGPYKAAEKSSEEQTDPLEELQKRAEAAGIGVNEIE